MAAAEFCENKFQKSNSKLIHAECENVAMIEKCDIKNLNNLVFALCEIPYHFQRALRRNNLYIFLVRLLRDGMPGICYLQ